MAKISAYPDGGAIQSTDKLVIARSGQNYSIPGSQIGSGLTISSASVTTSNVAGVEGTLHNLDVSGMTANRDFNLPTPTAAGKRIGVRLSTGDDTYALLLKINAVEWSRIFITNEIVVFVSTGTGAGNWVVEQDGRISQLGALSDVTPQNINHATYTKVTLGTNDADVGNIVSTSNSRITVRRAGKYVISGQIYFSNFASNSLLCTIYKNGSPILESAESTDNSNQYGVPKVGPHLMTLAAGDYIELYGRHIQGATQSMKLSGSPALLDVEEKLN